ncbi:MAG: helix-turn-helix transcriptional regulator [Ruminococcaceae bacterium]|nr:helix-turn-helix transcriptional regulator [Oscillospiraceae bacterium]
MSDSLNNRERQIKVLQQNLASIRKIAGWTTEELGEKIGVTKQTISNLENNKSPMNFTQYIAIRAVLDCEIENRKNEDDILANVVELLLDHSDELDEDSYKKVTESISTVAAAAAGGVTGTTLAGLFTGLALPVAKVAGGALLGTAGIASLPGVVAGAAGAVGAVWLKKLINKKNQK